MVTIWNLSHCHAKLGRTNLLIMEFNLKLIKKRDNSRFVLTAQT